MNKMVLMVLLLSSLAWSKDAVKVTVAATDAVTHEDRGGRAVMEKAIMGANAPTKQYESFNMDAIVNGQHVFLACDDPKGCEAPALGTYDGELKRGKWIRMTFTMPVTNKSVSRWYKIGGSW
jgi:hypothetical protein